MDVYTPHFFSDKRLPRLPKVQALSQLIRVSLSGYLPWILFSGEVVPFELSVHRHLV